MLLISVLLPLIGQTNSYAGKRDPSLEELTKQLRSAEWEIDVKTALRDIASLRRGGSAAGTEVLKVLRNSGVESRVAAVQTLGYIHYTPAGPNLRQLLNNSTDWRLVYTSINALGLMADKSALPLLHKVADQHWSPVVRETAHKAIETIEHQTPYESNWSAEKFAYRYFLLDDFNHGSPIISEDRRFVDEPESLKFDELKEINHSFDIVGYGPHGREIKSSIVSPKCAFRLGNGLLIGTDLGEWGGQLAYRSSENKISVLLEENTHAIHRMPFGVIATTGLAHLSSNNGYLYLIKKGADELPVAKLWKVLPGMPLKSGVLQDGDLYIECVGGTVLLSPSGEFRRSEITTQN